MIAWLLMNTLTAAFFASLVWGVIRLTQPAPGIRHALWLIVLLKLVSPVELFWSVPVALRPSSSAVAKQKEVVPEATSKTETPVYGLVSEEIFFVEDPNEKLAVTAEDDQLAEAEKSKPAEPTESIAAPGQFEAKNRWDIMLLFVWLAGGLYTIARLTRDTYRFGQFAKLAKKAPDSLGNEVALVANRMGLRTPGVRLLAGLASPVMWCIGKPVLLWPADLDKQVTGEGRKAVIAHELAHLRRRDHWVRWLEMVAAVVHWWNPIFWLARQRLRADAELACDQWAARQTDRRTYAEALLAVCMFQPRRRPAAAVGVLGEGKKEMQERLTHIMRYSAPTRAAFVAKLCVVLLGLASIPALTLGQAPTSVIDTEDLNLNDLENQIEYLFEFIDVDSTQAMPSDDEISAIKSRMTSLLKEYERFAEDLKRANSNNPSSSSVAEEQNAFAKRIDELKKLIDSTKARNNASFLEQKRIRTLLESATDKRPSELEMRSGVRDLTKMNDVQSTAKTTSANVKVIGADGVEIKGVTVLIDPAIHGPIGQNGTAISPPGRATVQYGFSTQAGSVPVAMAHCSQCHGPSKKFPDDMKCPVVFSESKVAMPMLSGLNSVGNPAFKPMESVALASAPSIRTDKGISTKSKAVYQLPKGMASKIAALLNGKHSGKIEAHADQDNLLVTTTPDVQKVIGNFLNLMNHAKSNGTINADKVSLMNVRPANAINVTGVASQAIIGPDIASGTIKTSPK